jgi:Domain of unknown function (DUF4389)
MAAFYATGGPASATEQPTLAPVLVGFAGPAPQSRLTVLVRILMVIPQLVVLWLLGVAALVIVIIGWFGALFTGRLPIFAADFLTGYLRWLTRVYAYVFLLTDQYPPFSLDDADYPVRVAVMPGQLNRLAVLFRIFLLIPCGIIQGIVAYGAFTIVQFVSWLIVLVSGRMPDALYQALAAALRYQIRTLGFALMLTSAYPAGLFGDPEVPEQWSSAGPPMAAAPLGYGGLPAYGGQPGYGQAGYGQPGFGVSGMQPGSGAGDERSWRLILSRAARKLVVGFVVLGVLVSVSIGVIDAVAIGSSVSAVAAANEVSTAVNPVRNAINDYPADVKACNNNFGCVTRLDRSVAATLDTFAGQLRAIPMPSRATAANAALVAAVSDTASIFARLGAATTPQQYISEAQSSGAQQSVDRINQAYTNLGTALGS